MICPHCGKQISHAVLTPFRQRLIELADGTRTADQIAEIVGKSASVVTATISQMRTKYGFKITTPHSNRIKAKDGTLLPHGARRYVDSRRELKE
jgi:hypothetical protein